MPSKAVRVRLTTNKLIRVSALMPAIATEIATSAVDEAVPIAKSKARVDTGAMREGVYRTSSSGSTYAEAASAARARKPTAEILPEEPRPSPGVAVLADVVGHGAPNEYGHVTAGGGYVPAQPFIRPAIAAVKGKLGKLADRAFKKFVR